MPDAVRQSRLYDEMSSRQAPHSLTLSINGHCVPYRLRHLLLRRVCTKCCAYVQASASGIGKKIEQDYLCQTVITCFFSLCNAIVSTACMVPNAMVLYGRTEPCLLDWLDSVHVCALSLFTGAIVRILEFGLLTNFVSQGFGLSGAKAVKHYVTVAHAANSIVNILREQDNLNIVKVTAHLRISEAT